MISQTSEEARTQIVNMVREFARQELDPIVAEYEREDTSTPGRHRRR